MIKAKPVVPDHYWILSQQGNKIGNIESNHDGYTVTINGRKKQYHDLKMLGSGMQVEFETASGSKQSLPKTVHGYPTTDDPYNPVFDVKHQLPLWTKDPDSHSWLAAGWYRIQLQKDWRVVLCPKLIILKRCQYEGPFRSREEAMNL